MLFGEKKIVKPHHWFTLFKYTIYVLLAWNGWIWFVDDHASAPEMFPGGVNLGNFHEAYSATIDTAFWLVLLYLFELETAVIPDHLLKGRLQKVLLAVRCVSYLFITSALFGYVVKLMMVTDYSAFAVDDICSLGGGSWNTYFSLDDYPPLDLASCTLLQGQELFRINGTEIIVTAADLRSATGLALVDVVNAASWLVIVALLEVEVYLQLKDHLSDKLLKVAGYLKIVFYGLLFICAVYWGFEGTFVDFWDAFLWLVAFIFIEMNIFQWHEEVEEAHLRESGQENSAA